MKHIGVARLPKAPSIHAGAATWKVVALAGLLVVGIGGAGLAVVGPAIVGQGAVQYLTATVAKTTVASKVVASGTVTPAVTYDLSFGGYPAVEAAGKPASSLGSGVWLVRSVAVTLGQAVKKGDVLAVADSTSAAAALQLAQAGLASAQARLAVDAAGPSAADRAAAYYAIAQAQQQLDAAKRSQSDGGARNTLAFTQAQASIAAAQNTLAADTASVTGKDQAALAAAQQQLASLQLAAYADGISAAQAVRAATAQLAQAQATLKTAQDTLAADQAAKASAATIAADQAAVATAQRQVNDASASLSDANAAWSLTQQKNALRISAEQTAISAAQTRLAQDSAPGGAAPASGTLRADLSALDQARQQLGALTLTNAIGARKAAASVAAADLALQIARNDYARHTVPTSAAVIASDQAAVASAQVAVSAAQRTLDGATLRSPIDGVVATLALTPGTLAPSGTAVAVEASSLQVLASVSEADLASLKVGQPVTVTLTALGTTATGTVAAIDPRGSVPGGGGVVTYHVRVALDSVPAHAAAAMSAQIAVVTAEAKNTLAVPSIALQGNTGHYTVRVLQPSGTVVDTPVQVGLITTTLTQITSGLTAGEQVITGTTAPLQTGTTPAGGLPGLLPQGGGGGGNGGG